MDPEENLFLSEPQLIILMGVLHHSNKEMSEIKNPGNFFGVTTLEGLAWALYQLKSQFSFKINLQFNQGDRKRFKEEAEKFRASFNIDNHPGVTAADGFYFRLNDESSNGDAYFQMMDMVRTSLEVNIFDMRTAENGSDLLRGVMDIKDNERQFLLKELCIVLERDGLETDRIVSEYLQTYSKKFRNGELNGVNSKPFYDHYGPFFRVCREEGLRKANFNQFKFDSTDIEKHSLGTKRSPKDEHWRFVDFLVSLHFQKIITIQAFSFTSFVRKKPEWHVEFKIDKKWVPVFKAKDWVNFKDLWLSEDGQVVFHCSSVKTWRVAGSDQCRILRILIDHPETDIPLTMLTSDDPSADTTVESIKVAVSAIKKDLDLKESSISDLTITSMNKYRTYRLNYR